MSTSEIAKLESLWRENPQGLTFAPLAEAYRKMKEPQRALDVLAEGLGRRPDYIPASIVLGRCHLDLGDDPAAEAAFSRVLELDGENVIALKALAEITERHLRFDEAEGWLRQLLAIDRSNDEARAQLTRVEDARRNAIGIVRDDAGRAVESMTGEMLTAEMPAEIASAASMDASPIESGPVELETPGAGHDFEPVAEIAADDPVHLAFDTASPLDPVAEELVPAPPSSSPMEHADELDLRSTGAGEFQSPDAAADLAGPSDDAFEDLGELDDFREQPTVELPAEQLPDPEWTPMSADQEITADSWAAPESAPAWPELEAPSEPAAADAAPEGLEQPDAPEVAEEPVASEAAYDEPAYDEPAYDEPAYDQQVSDEPAPKPAPLAPEPLEPALVVTESMAELYLQQGHAHEALTIYRELYLRQPDDTRLRDKVAALETAAAPVEAALESAPDYAAGPDGRTVAAMFRDLLAARPAAVVGWSPVARQEAAPDAGAPASSGEPTRPADDRLSLSAVFGDDSSPVPPAVPAGSPGAADGMSFDAFFDAAPLAAEPAPRRAAAREDDDLEQFHAWLQNLKR